MSALITVSIRDKRILTAKEVQSLLGEQVARDARAVGWLRPCVTKENPRNRRPLFTMTEVRAVEDRISAGEYPGQEKEARS